MLQYKRFLILFQKLFKMKVFQISKFSYGVCHHSIVFPFCYVPKYLKFLTWWKEASSTRDKMFKIALPRTILYLLVEGTLILKAY
jgi:hypothetical protein